MELHVSKVTQWVHLPYRGSCVFICLIGQSVIPPVSQVTLFVHMFYMIPCGGICLAGDPAGSTVSQRTLWVHLSHRELCWFSLKGNPGSPLSHASHWVNLSYRVCLGLTCLTGNPVVSPVSHKIQGTISVNMSHR